MTSHQTAFSVHVGYMVRLIEERSGEELSIRTLARIVGRQEAYLGRLFRQQMGMTVREYLACVRMDRAASLIRQGDKVEAVSLEVGYRSKKNFYRQFSRRFGMTPAVYRQRAAVQEARVDDTVPDQCGNPEVDRESRRTRPARIEPTAVRQISDIAGRLKRDAVFALTELEKTAGRSVATLTVFRTQLRRLHEQLLGTPALPETVRSAWTAVARPISELLRQLGPGLRAAGSPGPRPSDAAGPTAAADQEPSGRRPRVSQRTLRARVHSLMDDIQVATCGPTPRQYDELEQLRKEMADAMSSLNGVVMDDLPELNRLLEHHRMTPIPGVVVDLFAAAPEPDAMRAVAR